jgi:DNA-binding CsgD family transcriptional regulator
MAVNLHSLLYSPSFGAPHAAHLHDSDRCPACLSAVRRLNQLESATDDLRRELELGAHRLRTVLCQLALAEERAGHRTLAGALRSVAAGQSNLSFDDVSALLVEQESRAASPAAPAQRLSAREREVLRLITEGLRTPSIAARLGITAATVEVHRRNIMRKLGLHTVAGLTKYALREGLTSL